MARDPVLAAAEGEELVGRDGDVLEAQVTAQHDHAVLEAGLQGQFERFATGDVQAHQRHVDLSG
jgi:hypothetical protein